MGCLRISQRGIDLIKKWEGLEDGDKRKPGIQPYMDPVGIWTVGYGHAITVNGRFVRGAKQKDLAYDLYTDLSMQEVENLLRKDISRFEKAINRYVTAPIEQHEFDAFVSLSFNIGIGAFKRSSALRYHNMGRKDIVPRKIKLWNKAGGRVLRGLVRRRQEEADLYSRG